LQAQHLVAQDHDYAPVFDVAVLPALAEAASGLGLQAQMGRIA
jgi:hypothetical protein